MRRDRIAARRVWRGVIALGILAFLFLGLGGSWLAIVPAYFVVAGLFTLHRIGY